jgi:hypothetical protein
MEDYGLLDPVACLTCVGRGLLEIFDCGRGFSPPMPQRSGQTKCTRKHRLVIELLENVDHTVELPRDLRVAHLRHRVRTEVAQRDDCIGCHEPLLRRAPTLDCLRQHRVRPRQLA